jgi:hypothetical protein
VHHHGHGRKGICGELSTRAAVQLHEAPRYSGYVHSMHDGRREDDGPDIETKSSWACREATARNLGCSDVWIGGGGRLRNRGVGRMHCSKLTVEASRWLGICGRGAPLALVSVYCATGCTSTMTDASQWGVGIGVRGARDVGTDAGRARWCKRSHREVTRVTGHSLFGRTKSTAWFVSVSVCLLSA